MENAIAELFYYLNQGGFVMWPLVIATLFLWYGLGYRMATLRRGDRLSVRALIEHYRAGTESEPSGVVDTAVVRGLEIAGKGRENLRRLLDDGFSDLVEGIGKHAVLVRSIVIIAPLAGLLGTVTGMIETFDSLGEATLYTCLLYTSDAADD